MENGVWARVSSAIRHPFFRIFCVMHFVLCAVSYAAVEDRDRGAGSVEQLQMAELKRYYYGDARGGSAAPVTPMAISFYNDAVKYFETGEYEIADEAVRESLQLEARNPLAWELLGEIANLRQDFDKAEECYKKSYSLNPSPQVRAKLEKLAKERLIEGKFDTYTEERFVIKYRRDDAQYDGYFLKTLLRDTYREVSRSLGFYITNKIVVIFYKPEEFRYVTGQPFYIGGIYDGKIRLPAYQKGFREEDLRAVVAHEMTHAFVAYLSGLRAPAWIQEGLAQYQENRVRPIPTDMLKAAAARSGLIPIDRFLLTNLKPGVDPSGLVIFYQQAFSFTGYLVERFGMYRMKEILEEIRKGNDSFTAIEDVLKISVNRLESEWLALLQN
ncbi:MAG: Tetratricopeptide repeat protein [Candidatus Omnitrophica bacterium ADurb.Bin277]|nr:MAG: Tetratricopeptide repeat protein [Candidatus Omnitrophica bacterium ADurb.Bin277]